MFDMFRRKPTAVSEVDRYIIHAIHELIKETRTMALDVSKLNAAVSDNSSAVARNTLAVDALLASHSDPAGQTAVDAAAAALGTSTTALNTESAKAEAAVAPVVPVAPAA
jgi:hypothetical protein